MNHHSPKRTLPSVKPIPRDFGFIITRHVNSPQTNRYWNQSVKLINRLYPEASIVIIDDNSNQELVQTDPDTNYSNLTIIRSEYPGRGELLPYVYYLKHQWFSNAVIIHDSIFIHRRFAFDRVNCPVIPLWHHPYDKENLPNLLRISRQLKNNRNIMRKMQDVNELVGLLDFRKSKFNLCFGGQCFIRLSFLQLLEKKYEISKLVHVVKNRTDRCGLERVLGCLFCEEYSLLTKVKSLFGSISKYPKNFRYHFEDYEKDLTQHKLHNPIIKVWTGR